MHLLQQRIKTFAQNAFFAKNYVQSVANCDRRRAEIWLHWFDIRRSGTHSRWKLLLWLASVTTVDACHTQISGEFIFQQDKAPAYRAC